MGADYAQTVKAIAEAEAYPGPSLVIAYAPCINHGIKKGMDKAQTEEKLAVECGYWHNFRYNPAAEDKKFTLDSKAPTGDYQSSVSYTHLVLGCLHGFRNAVNCIMIRQRIGGQTALKRQLCHFGGRECAVRSSRMNV